MFLLTCNYVLKLVASQRDRGTQQALDDCNQFFVGEELVSNKIPLERRLHFHSKLAVALDCQPERFAVVHTSSNADGGLEVTYPKKCTSVQLTAED